jgi:long-chain acyl-CoA synthetase
MIMDTPKTSPQFLFHNYVKWETKKVALRRKKFGIWNEFSWSDYYFNVKYFSLGLISMGLNPGDKISIIGENTPEWYWADLATQAARATAVGIYPDSTPSETKYIIAHSDSTFVVAEDQEQVDKILAIREELPKLKKVIFWEEKGLWNYKDSVIINFKEVQELGKKYEKEHPLLIEDNISNASEDDIAIIVYTSGTTGTPKGVMLSHKALIDVCKRWLSVDPWLETDEYLSYISPAWATEHAMGIGGGLMSGLTVNFPEKPETVLENIREIGANILLFTPIQWENFYSAVQTKMLDADFLKRTAYDVFTHVGKTMVDYLTKKRKPRMFLRGLHSVGKWLLFRPLLDRLGLLKVRLAYCGGSAMSPDGFKFFHAIGVNLRNIYGLSELMTIGLQRQEDVKFGTCGHLASSDHISLEMKITENGEALFKGGGLFSGYYKDPESTNKALEGGWLHTGDALQMDNDRQLLFIGRAKELRMLSSGIKFSPQFIEARCTFNMYIKNAVILGDEKKDYISALIGINFETVGKWSEIRNIAYTTYVELSQKKEVRELIRVELTNISNYLPEDTRIEKFVILSKELDPDEQELTRTRKIRRSFLEERYKEVIEAIYSDKKTILVETEVKFQDGRVGKIQKELYINTIHTKSKE